MHILIDTRIFCLPRALFQVANIEYEDYRFTQEQWVDIKPSGTEFKLEATK